MKPDGVVECGLAIRDGRVAAALAPGETVDARRTIDAGGRYVLPGLLDTHLHLGTAAQSFAGDCASESRHAVTGGVTTLLPFVITRGSYGEVLAEMQKAVAREPRGHGVPRDHHPRGADRGDPASRPRVRRALVQDVHGLQGARDLAERHPGHGRRPDLLRLPAGGEGPGRHRHRPLREHGGDRSAPAAVHRRQPPGHRGVVGRAPGLRRAGGDPPHGRLRRSGGHRPADPAHGRRARLRVPPPEGVGARARGHRDVPPLPALRQGHRPRRDGQGESAAPERRARGGALATARRTARSTSSAPTTARSRRRSRAPTSGRRAPASRPAAQ